MGGRLGGEIPDWYLVINTAKYLGVPPWDLIRQPRYWFDFAQAAIAAESSAQEQIRKHQEGNR